MGAYEKKVDKVFKENKFPLFECEDDSSLWVTHSSKKPGRPYFRCQHTSADTKCNFFQRADVKLKKKRKAVKRKNTLKDIEPAEK